jgi:F0F1-type ATP synthase assembly protein I
MNKNSNKKMLIISALIIIALSIYNIVRIFSNASVGVFGYISYIANALAIICFLFDLKKHIQIKQETR